MLSRFVYPRNGKQLLDIERDIYRLTAKIGDQFVLRMLEKVHQDPKFVAKAVQRARSERQVPVKNKGYRLVNVLLLGGSKVVLNTPYFLDNHGLKPGTRKKRRCKSGRGFYPVLEALGIQNGVSPASRSEIALYTIQAASYEEAVKLLKRRDYSAQIKYPASAQINPPVHPHLDQFTKRATLPRLKKIIYISRCIARRLPRPKKCKDTLP